MVFIETQREVSKKRGKSRLFQRKNRLILLTLTLRTYVYLSGNSERSEQETWEKLPFLREKAPFLKTVTI